ncbi:2-C-methyl-D-erythritol 4-phosphate cytidylyltransferase [Quadrisphaera sp. INWT6]|uniref:IspD/TarI family cytidylyltransferase n=1 Tax=Quadrisphaera sp. INWT6 TaxID=2596917 RepID=UPI0035CD186C
MAAGAPKAFVLLEGRELLVHAAERVLRSGAVDQLVLVVPAGREGEALALVAGVPGAGAAAVRAVPGGADRRSSVAAGIAALDAGVDVVLVHDAARCLTPPAQVADVAAAVAAGHEAVVPGLAVTDTVRSTGLPGSSGEAGSVQLDRAVLRLVQTPQGFRRDVLERAHATAAGGDAPEAALAVTDDASLVELFGARVHVVPGHEEALKVTRPVDLLVASALLARERAGDPL